MLEPTLTQSAKPADCSKSLPQESEDEQKPVERVLRMPNQDELPCDHGVPMESQRHRL